MLRGVTAALRSSLGHPDPFELNYVEIGNEVRFGSGATADRRGLVMDTLTFVFNVIFVRVGLLLDDVSGPTRMKWLT